MHKCLYTLGSMLTRYAKSISSSRSRAMQPPVAGPTFTTPNPDFICPRRAATRVLGLIAGYCDSCCFFSAPKWYIVSSHAALSLAPARQHPQANAASTSSTDPQALSSHNRSHRPLFTPLTHPDPPDPDTRLTPDYDLKCTFSALSLPFTASATLSCRRRRSGGAEQLCRKRSLTPEG